MNEQAHRKWTNHCDLMIYVLKQESTDYQKNVDRPDPIRDFQLFIGPDTVPIL